MDERPRVGVGVMILRDGKILLGKRLSDFGKGEYASPGGHLEYFESFEQCARREVAEECGIEIENIRFQYLANVTRSTPKHYVHIGLIADYLSGNVQNKEPDKCEGWDWHVLTGVPSPLFIYTKFAIEAQLEGRTYFDSVV